jgi:hypothetical protein
MIDGRRNCRQGSATNSGWVLDDGSKAVNAVVRVPEIP